MRLVPIMTLITLSFCFHVVFCLEALPAVTDVPETDQETRKVLENAGCDAEDIEKFNLCLQKTSITITGGEIECQSLGNIFQCFPKCFCDHTKSIQDFTEEWKAQTSMKCTEIPPCGAPAPAPAPASALRPSAVPVSIAAAVSLVAITGRS